MTDNAQTGGTVDAIRKRHERLDGDFRLMPWEDAQALLDEIGRLRAAMMHTAAELVRHKWAAADDATADWMAAEAFRLRDASGQQSGRS